MIHLFAAELNRYGSRRGIRFVGLLLLIGAAVAGLLLYVNVDARSPFRLESLKDVFPGTSSLLTVLGLGVGASFIGAEWGAGTITTVLTWEPRRIRVLAIKALAGAAFVFVATCVFQVVLGFALLPSALATNTTGGTGAEWRADVFWIIVRGGIVAGLTSIIGFSIASLARNTAAAIVAGFVYLLFIENLLRQFKPEWQTWFFAENVAKFLVGGDEVTDLMDKTTGAAGATLAFYALVSLAAAIAAFRARDVT